MNTTTIKVDSLVRDRLAVIARERGMSLGELVKALADATPTRSELEERAAAATAYLRIHVSKELGDEELAVAEHVWLELEAGRVPATLGTPEATGGLAA
jgi:predicted DNA-binding ribbon-helix-helix protein